MELFKKYVVISDIQTEYGKIIPTGTTLEFISWKDRSHLYGGNSYNNERRLKFFQTKCGEDISERYNFEKLMPLAEFREERLNKILND